jgi:hypothetical protein
VRTSHRECCSISRRRVPSTNGTQVAPAGLIPSQLLEVGIEAPVSGWDGTVRLVTAGGIRIRCHLHTPAVLLRGIGVPRADRAVVLLGAGASRGASFCSPGRQVLPPLDADFFRLAQHLDERVYNEFAKPVLQFLREEFGAAGLPTLETVFTQLEGFEQFLRCRRRLNTGPPAPV